MIGWRQRHMCRCQEPAHERAPQKKPPITQMYLSPRLHETKTTEKLCRTVKSRDVTSTASLSEYGDG